MSNLVVVSTRVDPTSDAAIFERLLPDIEAMNPQDPAANGIDLRQACVTVLVASHRVAPFRDQAAALAVVETSVDVRAFDELADTAIATMRAEIIHLAASSPTPIVQAVVREARKHLDLLTTAADALACAGLFPPGFRKKLGGLHSHTSLRVGLMVMAILFEEAWPKLEGRTHLTRGDIHGAWSLARRLDQAVCTRAPRTEEQQARARVRKQAKVLLVTRYNVVRRVISFLRWHQGDADEIAPSLFAARMKRKARKRTVVAEPTPTLGALVLP